LDGGTPTTLGSRSPDCPPSSMVGAASLTGLAIDATSVYWTDYGCGTVMRAPLDGGEPVTLASTATVDRAIGVSELAQPNDIVVDAKSAYWTDENGWVLKLTPK